MIARCVWMRAWDVLEIFCTRRSYLTSLNYRYVWQMIRKICDLAMCLDVRLDASESFSFAVVEVGWQERWYRTSCS